MAEHYVDNQRFLEEISEYQKFRIDAKDKGEEPPPCPEYIGECFLKIANRLSYRPNFINYAFREDMISDGIENCVQYMNNFNPEKSKNPFAYFTQIIYYAFVRRIQKEKKQLYIKYKTMDSNASLGDNVDISEHDQICTILFLTLRKPKRKRRLPRNNQLHLNYSWVYETSNYYRHTLGCQKRQSGICRIF